MLYTEEDSVNDLLLYTAVYYKRLVIDAEDGQVDPQEDWKKALELFSKLIQHLESAPEEANAQDLYQIREEFNYLKTIYESLVPELLYVIEKGFVNVLSLIK